MVQIALAHSFIDALARLEPINAKRTAAFLDKLLEEPEAAGLHTEMVHGASDRSIRSLRVTVDLRAIAQRLGDQLVLLFVGHHDDAYSWARTHFSGCPPDAAKPSLVVLSDMSSPAQIAKAGTKSFASGTATSATPAPNQMCTIENSGELCRVLDDAGIDHGLVH